MEEHFEKDRMLTMTMILWYEALCWLTLSDCSQGWKVDVVKIIVDTIDLSEYLKFNFYYLVWYWGTLSGEEGEALPGRWLGISHRVGVGMWSWVLNKQGNLISRSMAKYITKAHILYPMLRETLKLALKYQVKTSWWEARNWIIFIKKVLS